MRHYFDVATNIPPHLSTPMGLVHVIFVVALLVFGAIIGQNVMARYSSHRTSASSEKSTPSQPPQRTQPRLVSPCGVRIVTEKTA
jgi:hypothetical protein